MDLWHGERHVFQLYGAGQDQLRRHKLPNAGFSRDSDGDNRRGERLDRHRATGNELRDDLGGELNGGAGVWTSDGVYALVRELWNGRAGEH